ncbi:MAG TPA: sulfatase-like hydrolase/transferase [Pirellulales bacterium]|nr:sulfatase-like hydrolase/transferase [Pirellulales bacterium]
MNLLVVVVDRLHAGFLGCYGNAWVSTPYCNRLAAESFLCDQAFVDQPELLSLCDSWWTGTHRLGRTSDREWPTLGERLRQAGFVTTCLTDEPLVAARAGAAFDEVIRVGTAAGEPTPREMAETIEETQLARVFAAAAEFVEGAREPFCLWLHASGMQAAWDAPYSLRDQYAEEDEPPPPDFVEPPKRYLTESDDPDSLWGVCQAYAGQVTLLDDCLGVLLASLEGENLLDDTLLMVVGARGFPLGRNGRLGDVDGALFGELVQTPWLMRFPDGFGAAARSQALVQPGDLAPTLVDALGLVVPENLFSRSLMPLVRDEEAWPRQAIALVGANGERALRTPAWYLRMPGSKSAGEEPAAELYGKPDDRWEVNDVATRCSDMAAAMQAAHAALAERLKSHETGDLPPLDDALVNELRY